MVIGLYDKFNIVKPLLRSSNSGFLLCLLIYGSIKIFTLIITSYILRQRLNLQNIQEEGKDR